MTSPTFSASRMRWTADRSSAGDGTSSESAKMNPDAQEGQPTGAQAQEAAGVTSESAKMDQGC